MLEALDRVEQLSLAYDLVVLERVGPWLERARDAATRGASARELEKVRRGLETAVTEAAARRADTLTLTHNEKIDELVADAAWLGVTPVEIAVVIVDPRSPDVPEKLCTRAWPVSVERATSLAADLVEFAPDTAEWLSRPGEPDEHRVVAVTLGRVMRTTRKTKSFADA